MKEGYVSVIAGGIFNAHTVCLRCGGLVHDQEAHDQFHEVLVAVGTALEAIAEALRGLRT